MTIRKVKELETEKLVMDLTGPQGNAFCLLAVAINLCKQMGLDKDIILDEMRKSDYEHLVDTFDKYFGEHVDLYR